jgi:phosphoribosyl 1,2-cyclic phosphate phosphodiesterase
MIEEGGKRLVVDVGPDFRQQMLATGGEEVHAVLVTHEHNDHVAGLDDVRPYNFKYFKDMPVYALPRVTDNLRRRYDYIFEKEPYPGAPMVRLIEVSGDTPLDVQGVRVIPIHIMHGRLPILGYRVGDFAYLTDVKSIPPSELPKLQGLEILVMSALRDQLHHSHLTLEEAVELAQELGATRTYFTHFSHWLGPHEKIAHRLPEGIQAGYDGLVLEC